MLEGKENLNAFPSTHSCDFTIPNKEVSLSSEKKEQYSRSVLI